MRTPLELARTRGIKTKRMSRRVSEREVLDVLRPYAGKVFLLDDAGTRSLCFQSDDGGYYDLIVEDDDLYLACKQYLRMWNFPSFSSTEEAGEWLGTSIPGSFLRLVAKSKPKFPVQG